VFGEVAEGFDVLHRLNDVYVDAESRPYQDIRSALWADVTRYVCLCLASCLNQANIQLADLYSVSHRFAWLMEWPFDSRQNNNDARYMMLVICVAFCIVLHILIFHNQVGYSLFATFIAIGDFLKSFYH